MRLNYLALAALLALPGGAARAQFVTTPQQFSQQQLQQFTQQAQQAVNPMQGFNAPLGTPTGPNGAPLPGTAAAGTLLGTDRAISRFGQTTQSEGGPLAVGPLGDPDRSMPATAVFGAAIFTREATAVSDAPNPNYIVVPGDRVSVRVWGAVEAEALGIVDPSGNLFLPSIGPIRIAGTRAGDVQRVVEQEVRRVFTSQVQVYAVLLSTQRIGVFVTGFVRTPGRFGGSAADSVIDFLVRAGGVDAGRGSYRDIQVVRGGRAVANLDLYGFLLNGTLPPVRLQEGDTLLVGRQRAVVGADGAVRNNYLFENPGRLMTGRELIDYARPLPSATNAIIRGSRGGAPFSRYVTLGELAAVTLSDQDNVSFITDQPARTVRVTVEGSRIGPSVLVADRDIQLCQLLDYVAVDPVLADTQSVFLLRPSVAAQQRRTIDEALDRLQRQLFLAVSSSTGQATIRAAEAQMVSSYIQNARRVQPEGRLVVSSNGRCTPVRLQDGDTIVIPERSETVMVPGEVTAPTAVVWRPGITIADYVRAAGGYGPRGNSSSMMIRRASGEVILEPGEAPRPGDELIALPYLDAKTFEIATDLMGLIYQVAEATRALSLL